MTTPFYTLQGAIFLVPVLIQGLLTHMLIIGPHRVTPNDIAATFASLLGRPVRVEVVPRETSESLVKSQGMRNPTPRIQMLDGFKEGRIEFQGGHAGPRKGNVTLETVLRTLV